MGARPLESPAIEIRLAVVMTGGVSLAVWIGGVAREIHRLVCGDGVYGELLEKLQATATLDVITGSSAGGLNGALLGFALANRVPPDQLDSIADVWLTDGDMEKLLRRPTASDPPSLLDGDDFFLPRLRAALETLRASKDARHEARPAEGTDLVVKITATSLQGDPDPFLDDFGARVDQSTHRAVFTFRRADLQGEHAADQLALAARSSSSFPAAFEASFVPIGARGPGGQADMEGIASFSSSRYVVDGGVLDNQPIGPALDEIYRQPAGGPVRRLLLYVNPDPGTPTPPPAAQPDQVPSLATVVGASVSTLPRHQSVATDLREIVRRNEQVTRQRQARRTALSARSDVVRLVQGTRSVYQSFLDIRVRDSVSSTSARVLSRAAELEMPEPVAEEAEHALVAAATMPGNWLPATYPADPPERWVWGIRPIEYGVSTMYDLLHEVAAVLPLDPSGADQRARLAEVWAQLGAIVSRANTIRALDDAYWQERMVDLQELATRDDDLAATAKTWATASYAAWPLWDEVPERLRRSAPSRSYTTRLLTLGAEMGAHGFELEDRDAVTSYTGELAADLARVIEEVMPVLDRAATRWSPDDNPIIDSHQHRRVEDTTLTWLVCLFISQLALGAADSPREQQVELMQVSGNLGHAVDPRRADRSAAATKLQGVSVGHFGGFLKQSWRANDWMWGRLDGASRLVHAVLDPVRLAQIVGLPARNASPEDHERALARAQTLMASLATGEDHPDPANGPISDAVREWLDAEPAAARSLDYLTVDRRTWPAALSLSACADLVTRRIHLELLPAELERVARSMRHSANDGGALSADALDFIDAVEAARAAGPAEDWTADEVEALLDACKVNDEEVGDELGNEAATRTVVQLGAVGSSLLAGRHAGIGKARNGFRPLRWLMVLVSILTRSAGNAGPAASLMTGGVLGASATAVALWLLGVDIGPGWVAAAVFILVVFGALSLLASGLVSAIPLTAAGLLVLVALTGDRLAAGFGTPTEGAGGWRAIAADHQAGASFLVAVVVAAAIVLLTVVAVRRLRVGRGDRPPESQPSAATGRGVVEVALETALTLGAFVAITWLVYRWLVGDCVSGADGCTIEQVLEGTRWSWQERANRTATVLFDNRVLVLALGLPLGILVLDQLRRWRFRARSTKWRREVARIRASRSSTPE